MSCTLFTGNNAIVRRVNFNLFVPLFDFSREYLNREVDNRMNTNSSLLIEDYPLLVSPTLAKEIGLSDAIVLQQVHFWISKRRHFEEGRYWVYNTYEGWQEQFPFWSVSTIKRTLVRLEESGLLITANYNKMKIDRTKWYTVDYDKLDDLAKKN